jgi:hypothetical protein
MCETFNLEFDTDTGIIAWADGDLYDEFAGPLMQMGDFWKIFLGRRIELDEEDLDGSLFIEAVLEDVLIFPLISGSKWETVEESPGIWVTRPIEPARSTLSGSASDSGESDTLADVIDRESMLPETGDQLEPGYVAESLPVEAHNYEPPDAESDEDETDEDEDQSSDDDSEDQGSDDDSDSEDQDSDEDSADSDFDSDEVRWP